MTVKKDATEINHLQNAIASVQANAEVLSNISDATVREVVKIHYNSMNNQVELEKEKILLEKEKIQSNSRQNTFEKCISLTIIVLIFGFLFFATIFFSQLGKYDIYEKILLFVFGFLSGIGIGGSSALVLAKKNQRTSQNN